MNCESTSVRLLCTLGEGMSHLVMEELEGLANDITQFPGKIVFNADSSDIPHLLNLKLVERIFLCILAEPVVIPANEFTHSGVSSVVAAALERIDSHWFSKCIQLWTRSSGHAFSGDLCSAKLFVKLRPKYLIRFTESVRTAAVQVLESRGNICFTPDAKLEINLILSNNVIFLGMPLTKNPISKRTYALHSGLRSTAATAVVRCIQDGVLLDPMCGKGILLCEATSAYNKYARSQREASRTSHFYLIGSDCSLGQLMDARENLLNLQSDSLPNTFQWDLVLCPLERTPFRAEICDSIACDLPFGNKYGVYYEDSEDFSDTAVQRCYQDCAELIKCTLRSGGEFRLLVASNLSDWFVDVLTRMNFTVNKTHALSMGTTKAAIITGHKTTVGRF